MSELAEREGRGLQPASARSVRGLAGVALAGLLHWLPLVLALALLAQIGILGLRPALLERQRLSRQAAGVRARNEALHARFDELKLQIEAWQDPVYIERVRRLRAGSSKP